MGDVILDLVVELLNEKGVMAEAAQPAGDMVAAQTTVAAVGLECVDQTEESATILVEMVSPADQGAKICQKRALKVYDILRSAGAICRQDKCTFLSKANMFCTPITAVFYGTETAEGWQPYVGYAATVAGVPLEKVTAFSATQRLVEKENAPAEKKWEFTLEEFLPAETQEPADPAEPFVLTVARGAWSDTYTGCKITSWERVTEKNGIRQIRRGTAEQRTGNK